MYTGLKHFHSFLPYLLLAILVTSIVVFFIRRSQGATFSRSSRILALLVLIFAHLQLIFGLVLYAISPLVKAAYESGEIMTDATYRLYAVEHFITMLAAIVLITIGYSRAKRKMDPPAKYRALLIFYTIGLLLILLRIPWDAWPVK